MKGNKSEVKNNVFKKSINPLQRERTTQLPIYRRKDGFIRFITLEDSYNRL